MFKNEVKRYNQNIYDNIKEIDKLLIDIKVNIHDLEKLGCDKGRLYKDMDFLGQAFYKFKSDFNTDIKKVV